MDYLIKLFLLIIAGCGAVFMVIFTSWLIYAFLSVIYETVKDLLRYASGKTKDNEKETDSYQD